MYIHVEFNVLYTHVCKEIKKTTFYKNPWRLLLISVPCIHFLQHESSCTVSTLIKTIFIMICMLKIARSIKVLRMNLFWWYPSMLTLLYIWCTNYDVCVYYFFYILNNVSIKFKQTKTTYFRTNNRINYIVIWFDLFNITPLSALATSFSGGRSRREPPTMGNW